jgi:catechol 2,3-dioxygenase-like lactoylglutathione lyase family enzyme
MIVGVKELRESEPFFEQILGFKKTASFTDTGTGAEGSVMLIDSPPGQVTELLLVPFRHERLPNPQHLAFEAATEAEFLTIFGRAKAAGLKIRAEPALTSERTGVGELTMDKRVYRNFYVLEPSGINVEVMCVKETR